MPLPAAEPIPARVPGTMAKTAAIATPDFVSSTLQKVAEAKDGRDMPDAGLRSLDHYKRALPPWRYYIRQMLLPLVRWETPYLAYFQNSVRSPALDSYFAISANLGTHTFYTIGLPVLFWCGYTSYGKGLVHILALGVYLTGFLKDMLSLPRPLSPPLQRITMTGYAALEYGFPSTHSTNAVSVAAYAILILRNPENTLPEGTKIALECLAYFYTVSIVVGRLYCGMHGFLDVISGSALGLVIGVLEFYYGPSLDLYMYGSSWLAPLVAALVMIMLVRIHPEPADDCPCFDDSVAFAGVVAGIELGTWTYGKTAWDPFDGHAHGSHFLDVSKLSWPVLVARLVLGVGIIFAWREAMKPALLRGLPHLYRLIARVGIQLPRRFFTPASQYETISPGLRLDNVFPAVSDIPRVVESMRQPKSRGRSVSIGPQSAADAYETLAYRERRRRESIGSNGSVKSKSSLSDLNEGGGGKGSGGGGGGGAEGTSSARRDVSTTRQRLKQYESMMGEGEVVMTPNRGDGGGDTYGLEEKDMFSRLQRPRVRYDVEVVTKLVVYAGIGWLSCAVIPAIFEMMGLGVNHLRTV